MTKSIRKEPRRTVAVRFVESIVCPGCLGRRFGAAHLARRLAGIDCRDC